MSHHSTPTMTEKRILENLAGGRCQLSLIREMLHHGTHLEIRDLDGHWQPAIRIVPTVGSRPVIEGVRYLMGPGDNTAYRVEDTQALWVRIRPDSRKAGQAP